MFNLVFGRGAMAQEISEVCRKSEDVEFAEFNNLPGGWDRECESYIPERAAETVFIHVGSGRDLGTAVEWSEKYDIPLIQGSTKLGTYADLVSSARAKATTINAPNLSLPIVRLMEAFPEFANSIKPGMEVDIVESHQFGKPDVSGTARAMAESINYPETNIAYTRDLNTQLALGVPKNILQDMHTITSCLMARA